VRCGCGNRSGGRLEWVPQCTDEFSGGDARGAQGGGGWWPNWICGRFVSRSKREKEWRAETRPIRSCWYRCGFTAASAGIGSGAKNWRGAARSARRFAGCVEGWEVNNRMLSDFRNRSRRSAGPVIHVLVDPHLSRGHLNRRLIFIGRSVNRNFRSPVAIVTNRIQRQVRGNAKKPGGELRTREVILARAINPQEGLSCARSSAVAVSRTIRWRKLTSGVRYFWQ